MGKQSRANLIHQALWASGCFLVRNRLSQSADTLHASEGEDADDTVELTRLVIFLFTQLTKL